MRDQFKELCSKAETAFSSSRYEDALNYCRLALKIEPGAPVIHALAGNVCYILGDLKGAEKYFRTAASMDKEDGDYCFFLGNTLLAQERLAEALRSYAAAIQLGCREDFQPKIYYLMGKISQEAGKYSDALKNFALFEEHGGTEPEYYDEYMEVLLSRVQIYSALENWEAAETEATQMKLLAPTNFGYYKLLFQVLLQQKKFREANALLREAQNLLLSISSAENLSEADQEELSANRIELHFDYVVFYCFLGEQNPEYFKKALSHLDTLETMSGLSDQDKAEVLVSKAEIFFRLHEEASGVPLLEQVAAMDDPELSEYLDRSRFSLINYYAGQKDYARAWPHVQAMKSSDSPFYRYHAIYMEAHLVQKTEQTQPLSDKPASYFFDRAIATFKNCTMLNPQDYTAHIYRAKCYVDTGKLDRARQISQLLPEEAQKQLDEYMEQCCADEKGQ